MLANLWCICFHRLNPVVISNGDRYVFLCTEWSR